MYFKVARIIHSIASTVAMIAAIVVGIEVDPTMGVGIAAATVATLRR